MASFSSSTASSVGAVGGSHARSNSSNKTYVRWGRRRKRRPTRTTSFGNGSRRDDSVEVIETEEGQDVDEEDVASAHCVYYCNDRDSRAVDTPVGSVHDVEDGTGVCNGDAPIVRDTSVDTAVVTFSDEDDDAEDGVGDTVVRSPTSSSVVAAAFFGAGPKRSTSSMTTGTTALTEDLNMDSLSRANSRGDKRSTKEAETRRREADKKVSMDMSQVLNTDVLTKPFNFVSGMVVTNPVNPFRKKSGLLNVLSKKGDRRRIVLKDGSFNLECHSGREAHRLVRDLFTLIIAMGWGAIVSVFSVAFISSWMIFGAVWYLVALTHGDLDHHAHDRGSPHSNETFVPCVEQLKDFTSCFLFSIETQHTIGYGGRSPTSQCPVAIVVMCVQSILGVIIQACMAGVIFAKFTIPTKRAETVIFSKNALVTLRNGFLHLAVQITDLRNRTSLIEGHVRMILVTKEETSEGESIPFYRTDLECGSDLCGVNDRVFLLWPTVVSHRIDRYSPLYDMGPKEMLRSNFEVVVVLEGTTPETGGAVQVRTSYLPNEILWGHRFAHESMRYDGEEETYTILHDSMDATVVDNTPRTSARQLEEEGAEEATV